MQYCHTWLCRLFTAQMYPVNKPSGATTQSRLDIPDWGQATQLERATDPLPGRTADDLGGRVDCHSLEGGFSGGQRMPRHRVWALDPVHEPLVCSTAQEWITWIHKPTWTLGPEAQDKLTGLVVTQVSFLSNLEIISTIFAKLQNSTRVPWGVFRSWLFQNSQNYSSYPFL